MNAYEQITGNDTASGFWSMIAERANDLVTQMRALPTVSQQLQFVVTYERDAQAIPDRYMQRGMLRIASILRDAFRESYLASESATLTDMNTVIAGASASLSDPSVG